MYFVDRSLAVIKPKQPFLDWLNSVPGSEVSLSLEDLRQDCTSLLIPECEEQEDGIAYIDELAERLFEMELAAWYEDTTLWPQKRSLKLFWEWFDVEIHCVVFDALDNDMTNSPLAPVLN